jgi:hypothetical protein
VIRVNQLKRHSNHQQLYFTRLEDRPQFDRAPAHVFPIAKLVASKCFSYYARWYCSRGWGDTLSQAQKLNPAPECSARPGHNHEPPPDPPHCGSLCWSVLSSCYRAVACLVLCLDEKELLSAGHRVHRAHKGSREQGPGSSSSFKAKPWHAVALSWHWQVSSKGRATRSKPEAAVAGEEVGVQTSQDVHATARAFITVVSWVV